MDQVASLEYEFTSRRPSNMVSKTSLVSLNLVREQSLILRNKQGKHLNFHMYFSQLLESFYLFGLLDFCERHVRFCVKISIVIFSRLL